MKYYLKLLIQQSQETFKINELSKSEKNGAFDHISFFKFFKGSSIEVPFSLGRTIRGSAFHNVNIDPFSKCLSNQDLLNFDENRFVNELLDFYLIEKHQKVADFINISNRVIQKMPSWAIAYPWEDLGFYQLHDCYLKILKENRIDYLETVEPAELKKDQYSFDYAKSHAKQFNNLIQKISEEGFNTSLTRPKIYVLKNKDNWRWCMAGDGNHRAYIMSSLKSLTLPVRITKIVDRSKSNKWANVVNGEYTQREAEHIFDTVFRGDSRIRGCF